MISFYNLEAWFVTGSQHLYGQETLDIVAEHSKEIAGALNQSDLIPVKIKYIPVLTIRIVNEVNYKFSTFW